MAYGHIPSVPVSGVTSFPLSFYFPLPLIRTLVVHSGLQILDLTMSAKSMPFEGNFAGSGAQGLVSLGPQLTITDLLLSQPPWHTGVWHALGAE